MQNESHVDFNQQFSQVSAGFDGRVSYSATFLETGRFLSAGGDLKHATASVIKLPILVHALLSVEEGIVALDQPITLREAEKTPGSGILTHLSDGLTITLRDACMLMNIISDNTATNMLIDLLGVEAINQRMRNLGLPETTLFRKVFGADPNISGANLQYGLGVTTPNEMVRLLSLIATDALGPGVQQTLLREILSKQFYREGISRLLSAEYKYEGKTGAVDGVRNDVGIVTTPNGKQIALAIFCDQMPAPLWTADNPGLLTIARLAKLVVESLA